MWLIPCSSRTSSARSASPFETWASAAAPKITRLESCPVAPNGARSIMTTTLGPGPAGRPRRRPVGPAVALDLDLLQRLAGVARREGDPDQAAHHEEPGQDPRDGPEPGARGQHRDEEAPQPQADAHHREHEALGGAARQRPEQLPAPELEERLLPEPATGPGEDHIAQGHRRGEREDDEQ